MIPQLEICPRCESVETHLLATNNEWEYYCQDCDIRFNEDGVILLRTTKQTHEIFKDAKLYTEEV